AVDFALLQELSKELPSALEFAVLAAALSSAPRVFAVPAAPCAVLASSRLLFAAATAGVAWFIAVSADVLAVPFFAFAWPIGSFAASGDVGLSAALLVSSILALSASTFGGRALASFRACASSVALAAAAVFAARTFTSVAAVASAATVALLSASAA